MGCFDSVKYRCVCGEEVEWQSKAGDCVLDKYDISDVPINVARDLDGSWEVCSCGREYFLSIYCSPPSRVRMEVDCYED